MIDFEQGLKCASKMWPCLTECLTKFFSSGNPQKEKKLKARVLCSHMELFVAKHLSDHAITVTYNCHKFLSRSIKKDQLS